MTCLCTHRGEADVYLHPVRSLGTRREWVASTTARPLYSLLHLTGGLLSLMVGLDRHEKYRLHWDSIPDGPTRLDHIEVQHSVGLV